jgi:choline kinase
MNYFILVAGKGTRLNPLTYNYPKSLYRLDAEKTVLQHMVDLIKESDSSAKIYIVIGFLAESISSGIDGVCFIRNPFYSITNSIASLWFAREYLEGSSVVINGDVVLSRKLMMDIVSKPVSDPVVLVDSSIKTNGDYNVQVHNNHVVAMSKDLKDYFGEYGGISLLDTKSSKLLRQEIELMVNDGLVTQWYEDALVQMIFRYNFKLGYVDIANYDWTEIDEVSDLVVAQTIYSKDTK